MFACECPTWLSAVSKHSKDAVRSNFRPVCQTVIIEALTLKDGVRFSLDDLLRSGRDEAARLEVASRRLRALASGWRPTPWQRTRPHATHDDDLLQRAATTQSALRSDLRDLDKHLAAAREASPDAGVLNCGHRLEVWRKLLSLCQASDVQGFLAMTGAHDWLMKESPAVAAKRALVSGGADSPAWKELLREAEALANRHAYSQTPEWKRVYANQLEQGRSLQPLVRLLEARVKKGSDAFEAARAAHDETIHRSVAVAQRESVGRLEESIHAAGHLITELESVDRRESEALQALHAPVRALLESLPFTFRVPLLLTEQDHDLAMIWARGAGESSFHDSRMHSARQAELTAIEMYRELYGAAEDLSIGQLRLDGDRRWESADIASGGRWIDVKNARRSFSSRNNYSEHCVPRFKLDRRGQDVFISAFLSPYRPHEFDGAAEPLVWLGETTRSEIAELEQAFGSPHLSVSFSEIEASLLPPWLFDYPSSFYKNRDAALSRLRGPGYTLPIQDVHPSIALLARGAEGFLGPVPPEAVSPSISCDAELLELARRLASVRTVRRSVVFLHLLDRFCRSLLEDKAFPGEQLRWLLYPPMGTSPSALAAIHHPLVLCDPLGVVSELLAVLSKASETCRGLALAFTRFRLRGSGILQGFANTGRWRTIIAYCGGWGRLRDGRSVRCGQNPVFLGQDESCTECERLICHRCGYCGQGCPECLPRQQDWPAMEPLPRSGSS